MSLFSSSFPSLIRPGIVPGFSTYTLHTAELALSSLKTMLNKKEQQVP